MSTVNSPAEQFVFAQSVEGLFERGLGNEVPPALREKLKALGLDLSKKLLPAYPVPVWNQVLEATARSLSPADPLPVSARRLGERMMEGYRHTLGGQALMAMARIIGPRRALLRSQKNWRTGNNYSEVTVTELSPTDFRAVFNEQSVSRWVSQGLLSTGLALAGAQEPSVEIEGFTDTEVTYRITWK